MLSDHKAYYKNNLYLYIFIICDKDMSPIQAVFTVKKEKKPWKLWEETNQEMNKNLVNC